MKPRRNKVKSQALGPPWEQLDSPADLWRFPSWGYPLNHPSHEWPSYIKVYVGRSPSYAFWTWIGHQNINDIKLSNQSSILKEPGWLDLLVLDVIFHHHQVHSYLVSHLLTGAGFTRRTHRPRGRDFCWSPACRGSPSRPRREASGWVSNKWLGQATNRCWVKQHMVAAYMIFFSPDSYGKTYIFVG